RDRSQLVLLFWGYNAMIVAIKFILSPSAYRSTTTTSSLGEFVAVGLVAMTFYVIGLVVVHATATRGRSWAAKAAVVAALVVLALLARWVAAVVLGAAGDAYFEHLYRGSGLILAGLVVVTALLAVEAFARAGDPGRALGDGFALILIYHGLWVVSMFKLFG